MSGKVTIQHNLEEIFDVTKESWYHGYLNANQVCINSLASKSSFGQLRIIGIEGDLKFGARTRAEWHYLQQDLERGVAEGIVHVRPQFIRIPLEELREELEWTQRKKGRRVIIASVPARLGENMDVMKNVEAICADFDEVHLTFSRSGDLIDKVFSSSSTPQPPVPVPTECPRSSTSTSPATPQPQPKCITLATPQLQRKCFTCDSPLVHLEMLHHGWCPTCRAWRIAK